jgi:hypothetical protein
MEGATQVPMPKKPDMEKYCYHCGKRMERKRFNGVLESNHAFQRRKYCNRTCMAKAQLQEDARLAALRKRAERFRGRACEMCGATESLAVHHKDFDPANNSPENLTTLCGSCHTKWHWIHGKSKWKRQSVCKICGEPARKLDMCQKHYQRFRKYGDPCLTKKRVGSHYELVRETLGQPNGPVYLV